MATTQRKFLEMSEKHKALAAFTLDHVGQSLRERIEQWNVLYPDWSYIRQTTFGWDSLQAVRRVKERDDRRIQQLRDIIATLSDEDVRIVRQMLGEREAS